MKKISKKFVVGMEDTAKKVGSGDLEVLATPALLAKVEYTAKEYLNEVLAKEETSVGTSLSVNHLHPSKVGATILVDITVDAQKTTKINFSFKVYDGEKLVALGSHQRAVILTLPFLKKLEVLN